MPCDDCIHAQWKRTSNGRLHPDKTGRCTYVWTPPPIPTAFYIVGAYGDRTPSLSGGFIERGERRTDACPCYEKAQ